MNKGEYRVVNKALWEVCRLFPAGHYKEAFILLFLESGPLTNWTGLFLAPIVDIASYTKLCPEEVATCIKNLCKWNAIVYDDARQLVYVKGLMERQVKNINAKYKIGAENRAAGFAADSPATEAFVKEREQMLKK